MNLTLIRKLSEKKKIPMSAICKTIGISETGLQQSMKRNTIKASALELIANELHEPVMVFFGNPNELDKLPNLSTFGERFKWILENKNSSSYAYAKILGVNHTTVTRLVNNKREPGFEILTKIIADNKNIPINWLLFGNDSYIKNDVTNIAAEQEIPYNKSCKTCDLNLKTIKNQQKLIETLEKELNDCYNKLKLIKGGKHAG